MPILCTRIFLSLMITGTFNTPQLLMLAGIGPSQHLQELGIPILQDLKVGQNMHDHLAYPALAFLTNKIISILPEGVLTVQSLNDFLFNGTGPFTSLGGVEAIAYIKTNASREKDNFPDIELLFVPGNLASDFGIIIRRSLRISMDIYNSFLAPLQNKSSWSIFPMLLHPKSVGYLKLRSRNPYHYPLLYGNYFTDPEDHDINTFVAAIRYIQKISKTAPFRKLNSRQNNRAVPGCQFYQLDSDEYWRCALRSLSVTLHHQVGTAKMGPPSDPGAVVNHELRVYGVGGLRVADCSVIPFALSAHTNAPAMMVGEKAADLIKTSWDKL